MDVAQKTQAIKRKVGLHQIRAPAQKRKLAQKEPAEWEKLLQTIYLMRG